MLTVTNAVERAAIADQSTLEGPAIVAAIFLTRVTCGSEKADAVRGEIKSAMLENLKLANSTVNALIATGLKLAFHLTSSKGKLTQDKAMLTSIATEAEADKITLLMDLLHQKRVTITGKDKQPLSVPVHNRATLQRFIAPPKAAKVNPLKDLRRILAKHGAAIGVDGLAAFRGDVEAAIKAVAAEAEAAALAELEAETAPRTGTDG